MWEKRFHAINDGLKLEIFEWKGRKVDIFSTEQNEKKERLCISSLFMICFQSRPFDLEMRAGPVLLAKTT